MTDDGTYPICDAQIHAPDVPHAGKVGGIDYEVLIAEMDGAGVDRSIVVPPASPGPDPSLNNAAALELAARDMDRLAVMGRFNLTDPTQGETLADWRSVPGMLGVRVSFVLPSNRVLLGEPELDWFWEGAAKANVPIMALVTNEQIPLLGSVANRFEDLRITVDHFGFTPYVHYEDLMEPLHVVIGLAPLPNVSIKASALPDSVSESYPFKSLHDPIEMVIEAFEPRRVFWGSDLTRLKCTYAECLGLFTHELPFLSDLDKEWVLGRGLIEWLEWNVPAALNVKEPSVCGVDSTQVG
jgi:predicted TIM-barrel fold metal-dependent hydrolase